jgi:hypothetical protein
MMRLDISLSKSVSCLEELRGLKMTFCKSCKKLYLENRDEWLKSDDKYGYVVMQKVGKLSYRCKCNRCGFVWLTRSSDASYQYNEPLKYKAEQVMINKFHRNLVEERKRGYEIHTYPKTTSNAI